MYYRSHGFKTHKKKGIKLQIGGDRKIIKIIKKIQLNA